MQSKVLIIGYGIVGRYLHDELYGLNPDIYDKYNSEYVNKKSEKYDLGFICVDTPLKEDGTLDTSEVEKAIEENECEIYCIKSTCPVGNVDRLKEKYGKRIICSPEFSGNTVNSKNYKYNFTIFGGAKEDCAKAVQMVLPCYDGRHQFRIVDAKLAELDKFMENSFLATKVSFCQSFYNVCKQENINYEELRELFTMDPRINPSHTFVYEDSPYWDSHCLNKDVPAIAKQYDMKLIKDVVLFNENQKTQYKEELKKDLFKNKRLFINE